MNYLKIFSQGFQDNWDLPAVTDFDTKLTLSYGSLAARMMRIHMLLGEMNIKVGARVAVIGRNSVNWITAYAGALTYGACLVTMPPNVPMADMMAMLDEVEVELLFIDADMVNEHTDFSASQKLKMVISMDTSRVLARKSLDIDDPQRVLDMLDATFVSRFPFGFMKDHAVAPVVAPETVVAIFFTSGTMGYPKAVMLMADNLEGNIIYGIKTAIHPHNSCSITSTTLGTVWGTIFDTLVPLASGAHLTVVKDVRNPASLAHAFMSIKPGHIMLSSHIMERFYEYAISVNSRRPLARWLSAMPGGKRLVSRMLKSTMNKLLGGRCREVFVGNTTLSASMAYKMQQAGVKLTVVYGLTECGGLVSYVPYQQYTPGSVGRVISSLIKCRVRPYDIPGFPPEAGILEVKGMTVMKGYCGDPELTATVTTDDGWLSTGDIVTISPEGDITLLGRRDSLITLERGAVAPERLETLLYSIPEISHAIVVKRDGKLTAIIYPDYEKIKQLHKQSADVGHIIQGAVNDVNRQVSLLEHISDVEISSEPLVLNFKGTVARHLYTVIS